MCDPVLILEFLVDCPIEDMKNIVCGLIETAM